MGHWDNAGGAQSGKLLLEARNLRGRLAAVHPRPHEALEWWQANHRPALAFPRWLGREARVEESPAPEPVTQNVRQAIPTTVTKCCAPEQAENFAPNTAIDDCKTTTTTLGTSRADMTCSRRHDLPDARKKTFKALLPRHHVCPDPFDEGPSRNADLSNR